MFTGAWEAHIPMAERRAKADGGERSVEPTSRSHKDHRRLSCSAKPYVAKRSDLLPVPARSAKAPRPCPTMRRR